MSPLDLKPAMDQGCVHDLSSFLSFYMGVCHNSGFLHKEGEICVFFIFSCCSLCFSLFFFVFPRMFRS